MAKEFDGSPSSDDVDESLIDEIVERLRGCKERQFLIINHMRLEQLNFCYQTMLYLTHGTNATVSYDLDQPRMSVGEVAVEGDLLDFNDPERFARAAEFADNMDIYPLTNGKIRLSFGFNRLTMG